MLVKSTERYPFASKQNLGHFAVTVASTAHTKVSTLLIIVMVIGLCGVQFGL